MYLVEGDDSDRNEAWEFLDSDGEDIVNDDNSSGLLIAIQKITPCKGLVVNQ